MKKFIFYILTFIILSVLACGGRGMYAVAKPTAATVFDTVPEPLMPDASRADGLLKDSLPKDTLAKDTLLPFPTISKTPIKSRLRKEKVDLDNPVKFTSNDSLLIIRRDSAFMYGKSEVEYGDLVLKAAQIEMDLQNNNVYAVGALDSLGKVEGTPVFTQDGTDYEAQTMKYNFKTAKGFLTDIITEQGEGYITGGIAKKDRDGNYYLRDGKYTTCDNHDCPHFYFQLSKTKVKPGKNAVFGPSYMVLAGLPLPIAVPFGYFPFTESYASGVIVPSFGDDYNRGFYLSDGGYYFAINQNMDLSLTGEIYTKGSWGLRAQSSYVKRYKYSGSFNVSYLKTVQGEKGDPDYSASTNFQVLWSHVQDTKANPNMNLSASVNFTTSGYTRNSLNTYYSPSFTENTKSSTVSMSYKFPRSKWSLATTFNVSQRTQDSTLAVSFPNVTLTMAQTYPFKRKKAAGDERWYEKIRMSYSGQLQNSLTAKQNVFFKKSLIKDWRNGMKHNIPISATFNVLRYINITPSLRLDDRIYTTKVKRSWDAEAQREMMDTTYSFYNVWDFNTGVSMDTKMYLFFQPLGFMGKKVKMIRWVMTPTMTFGGNPDFSSKFFGYYGTYQRPGANGQMLLHKYTYFSNQLYGVPGEGKSAALSYALSNNLEMKLRTPNDSIQEKKVSLIENLNLSQSYNFAADSLKFSDLSTSIMLRLTRDFNLNLNATWDVYTYQLNSNGQPVRVNVPRWKAGKGIGRLRNTGTSFSYTLNNETFKRKPKDKKTPSPDTDNPDADNRQDNFGNRNRDDEESGSQGDMQFVNGYMKWEFPWSLSLNYSINYGYGDFNYEKLEYNGKITQNLSLSGNVRPTKNWNFNFTASYDFQLKKLAYMNCNISRDLHCFTMSASFVPIGPYKSYNFHIAVKSALLSDFKYDKRSSYSNGVTWY